MVEFPTWALHLDSSSILRDSFSCNCFVCNRWAELCWSRDANMRVWLSCSRWIWLTCCSWTLSNCFFTLVSSFSANSLLAWKCFSLRWWDSWVWVSSSLASCSSFFIVTTTASKLLIFSSCLCTVSVNSLTSKDCKQFHHYSTHAKTWPFSLSVLYMTIPPFLSLQLPNQQSTRCKRMI